MTSPAVFSYGNLGSNPLPYAPLVLQRGTAKVHIPALVDSGAAVNVLPFQIGLQLGAIWDQQTTKLKLAGNLETSEARALLLDCHVASFPPVRLAFAWTENTNVPVLLGQTNFFMEFDVRFLRSQSRFEISPRSG